MKILSEKEVKFVNMELDMTDEEEKTLLQYADENMPENELKRLTVEWAFIDLLKKSLKEFKPKKKEKKK